MIATTAAMATWVLMVRLTSSVYPEEHRQWDQNYSQIATPQECETLAKNWWQQFYVHYGQNPEQSHLNFHTECAASAHGTNWRWTVNCNNTMSCTTIKYEGKY